MIDLKNVQNYRENNRIEAKKALGGFPQSVWETYSAFANTLGGIILLGVREEKDKSLHPVYLPNPEALLAQFWATVNDVSKVSANVLSEKDVEIVEADGCRFIAIHVPRAARQDKPVFIGGNPTGTYRRSGEGDYRCTEEEILAMQRDASRLSQDMRVVAELDISALNNSSVERYKKFVREHRLHTTLAKMETNALLQKIGAAVERDGKLYPTYAGVLALGTRKAIKSLCPHFHLQFTEYKVVKISTDEKGDCGNVFEFFLQVNSALRERLGDEEKACAAATEVLINALVNADYHAKGGVYVMSKTSELLFSNAGGFRMGVDKAKSGGVSDPRNAGLLKIFRYAGIGNGTGSGIPNVFSLWGTLRKGTPIIRESFHPDRVSVSLPLKEKTSKKTSLKSKAGKMNLGDFERRAIVEYLTARIQANAGEIAAALRLSSADVKARLEELVEEGVLRKEKGKYALKS